MKWTPEPSPNEQRVASSLRPASHFYKFLWEIRGELFADGFEDELLASYQPRGQAPCPPAMLAMVMLLQRYDGLSDADAVDAAENDRRWQLVLGTLSDGRAPFGQGTLVRFRTRMMAHDLDKKLVDRTVALAKASSTFGWTKLRVALDSSPLFGAGRVEDTWNLIGRAMSKVVHAVSTALDVPEDEVVAKAQLKVLSASSIKAAIDIDWDDDEKKQAALEELLAQVTRLEAWVAKRAGPKVNEPPLDAVLDQLRRVVDQDTEPDPPGGGKRRIRDGVASERLISLSDPEMRHGRKSRSKRFDGYKRHVAVVDNLIVATALEPANVREYEPAERLLRVVAKHGDIATVDIDRGYLSSPAVEALHDAGVVINSRPWAVGNQGRFTKADFRFDLARRRVTCPAGEATPFTPGGIAYFDRRACGACALKPKCTEAPGRTLQIHPREDLFVKLRRNAQTRPGRAELRRRTSVEHRLARIAVVQGPRARYCGARKNELDVNRAAAVVNLFEVALRRAA